MAKLRKALQIFFIVVFFAYVFYSTYGIFLGYDLWFHLKNGEFILQNHYIPHQDPFSFSAAKYPPYYFTNYMWLFGVITYIIYSLWHFTGIDTARSFLILFTFIILFVTSLNKSKEYRSSPTLVPVTLIILLVAFFASYQRFEPRPQLVTSFFLASFLYFLISDRLKYYHHILFVIMTFIWTNCHIEALLGIFAVMLSVFQKAITLKSDKSWRPLRDRLVALAFILITFFISPCSGGLIREGASFYTGKTSSKNIVELLPSDISILLKPYGFLLILGIITFLLMIYVDKKKLRELVLFIPFAVLPLLSNRYTFPSSIVIAPILVLTSETVISFMLSRRLQWSSAAGLILILIFPVVLIGSGRHFLHGRIEPPPISCGANLSRYHNKSPFPDGAIRFLNAKRIEGNIFCPYHWGNFLVFYQNPFKYNVINSEGSAAEERIIRRKPFITGMNQIFPPEILDEYIEILTMPDKREFYFIKYAFDIFILPYPESSSDSFYSLNLYLASKKGWKLLYWDDSSIVYGKQNLLQEEKAFSFTNPAKLQVEGIGQDDRFMAETLRELNMSLGEEPGGKVVKTRLWMGLIYFRMGRLDDSTAALETGRDLMPDNAAILYNLAVAYIKKGDLERGVKYLEDSLKADPAFGPAVDLKRRALKPVH